MFNSPTFGKRSPNQLVQDITKYIQADDQASYRLIIGSDSHLRGVKSKSYLRLVTAIVIHKLGFGGRYFWQLQKSTVPKSIRDKIYQETLASIETAKVFLPQLNQTLNGNGHYDLEIHIDVGRQGKTRDMIKEVVGIVTGNGFIAKTKPESYGASKIADKHT